MKEETNSQSPFFYCRTKKRKTKEDIFSREEIPDDNQNAIILLFIRPAERERKALFIYSLTVVIHLHKRKPWASILCLLI